MRLLFITSSRIGDAVLSTGLLSHLIEAGMTRVTIACGPAAAPLFRNVPGLERIILLEKHHRLGHWWDLWRATAARRWDMICDLRGSALGYVLRARRRFRFRPNLGPDHRVVQLGRAMGSDPIPAPRLWLSPEDEARADALIPPGPPILALGPTANWHGKQWPAEYFLALAEILTASDGPLPGARILVLGGGGTERESALPLLRGLAEKTVIDLVGNSELLTAAAALRKAALFIGNDSAPMHMAAALGVPTLGLFGPSREMHYAPYGPLGRAVRGALSYDQIVGAADYDRFKPTSYMTSLDVETVAAAARDILRPQCAA